MAEMRFKYPWIFEATGQGPLAAFGLAAVWTNVDTGVQLSARVDDVGGDVLRLSVMVITPNLAMGPVDLSRALTGAGVPVEMALADFTLEEIANVWNAAIRELMPAEGV